ncbi:MAG: cation diffusion facilitator family transporter [Desulfotomaculaceae bacterium]|nr:cation diffusion facilitator family transporter [Desulfotomaculaceae bacterium]
MDEKAKVALLSIGSNTFLTLGKLFVGLSMGAVSVISEAIHSSLDLVAAIIAFFAVRTAAKPADERHNYGHGKFENLSSIIEAILILVAGVMIINNAIPKLQGGGEIENLGLGAGVMGISAVVNLFISRQLLKTAKKTDSPALAADGWHLMTDVYTSMGVFAGLGAIYLTGLTILDPIIAIAVALLIFKAAFKLISESVRNILDTNLPPTEEKLIQKILYSYAEEYIEFHDLRTRKAGSDRYVDLHLVVPKYKDIDAVHTLCDRIEDDLRTQLPSVQVLIHTEPCRAHCEDIWMIK